MLGRIGLLPGFLLVLWIGSSYGQRPIFGNIFPGPRPQAVQRQDCTVPDTNQIGTCMTSADCTSSEGRNKGRCPHGGVCCVMESTCAESIKRNSSYFANPDFPNDYSLSGNCIVTVNRVSHSICQLRFDLLQFELAPPSKGYCHLDQMLVLGVQGIPVLCGVNNGQHIYVDFPQGVNSVPVSIVTTGNAYSRKWLMKISQIECNSPSIAPSGCFQYYTGTLGTLRSFNWEADESRKGYQGGLNYGTCIRREAGFCSIKYSSNPPFEVGVTDELREHSGTEEVCTRDFIIIPNAAMEGSVVRSNKFCGNRFSVENNSSEDREVISRIAPFVVYMITDKTNDTKGGQGFSLNWQQAPCSA